MAVIAVNTAWLMEGCYGIAELCLISMKKFYNSLLIQILLVVPLVQHASAVTAPTTRFQGSTSGVLRTMTQEL